MSFPTVQLSGFNVVLECTSSQSEMSILQRCSITLYHVENMNVLPDGQCLKPGKIYLNDRRYECVGATGFKSLEMLDVMWSWF
jgi:hypothetical protein